MTTLIAITMLVVVLGYLLVLAVAVRSRRSAHRGPEDGEGNDGGSGAPAAPVPPKPTTGGDEPYWWPEFEREFRA